MLNTNATRFMKSKTAKEMLSNHVLTDMQKRRLNKLFEVYECRELHDWHRAIATFILNDLSNFLGRLNRIKKYRKADKYGTFLRNGKENYLDVYNDVCKRKTSHFKNKVEYWLDQGYDQDTAIIFISEIQKQRNKTASDKMRGSSQYTVRSVDYWLRKGFSYEDAKAEVRRVQTTNGLDFYIEKYGKIDGPEKYEKRINQWLSSLDEKPLEEKQLISLKKSHSVAGAMARGLPLEDAIEVQNKNHSHMRSIQRMASQISQDFFKKLDDMIAGTAFYNDKNYEFLVGKYRVDFYHKETKTVIEFYGDFYHRNPKLFKSDFVSFGLTSSDKWIYDETRKNEILSHKTVDNFYVIWENDYRKRPDECLELMRNTINGKY